jgi:hypothetical protein
MTGRRRSIRYACAVPHEGELRVAYDVIVESRSEREVVAWSDAPQVRGQALTLELGLSEPADGVSARVVECEPIVVEGNLRYRLRFAIEAGEDAVRT